VVPVPAQDKSSLTTTGSPFVKVGHDVAGGSGVGAASIINARHLSIGGSLIGGSGVASAFVSNINVAMDSVRIAHDLIGGSIAGNRGDTDQLRLYRIIQQYRPDLHRRLDHCGD
jgi:hypothetical protein